MNRSNRGGKRPMTHCARTGGVLLMLVQGLVGCSRSDSQPPTPLAPSAVQQPVNPTGLQPTVTGVRPNVVSTSGSWGTVTGTQFERGATVKVSDKVLFATFVSSTELRFVPSAPHAVGTVDVTVTNPGGFSTTLPASYTYAVPDTFDFNGDWIAHALENDDWMIDMRFTIRNGVLVSLSCGTSAGLTLSAPLQIIHGSFSLAGDDGLRFSGTIRSTETSEGQTNAPGCGDGYWWADKADLSR